VFSWLWRRRDIFRYWDGRRERAIDPLVAWARMWEDPQCDPQRDFGPATGMSGEGLPVDFDPAARDRVLAMARRMFDVQEFSESTPGLTIDETFSLLWTFIGFMNAIKKKRAPLPTMSPPTPSPTSEGSTTRPASDSTSTGTESTNGEPSSSSKRSIRL